MTVMLDDVGIVDMPSTDQPKELGENEPVLADGKGERIAFSGI